MKKITKSIFVQFFGLFKRGITISLILAMVGLNAPMVFAVSSSELDISCGEVSVSGNTWTLNGTWSAIDFQGQSNQYDVAIFSPSGTSADVSSKDTPDSFIIVNGPDNYAGEGNKDDMAGNWSNQIIFLTPPASISATLYHSQVPGNEISGDAVCTFDINDAPILSDVPPSVTIPELVDYTFTATATDSDSGDTLIYSLSGAPAGASINPSTGVFTWNPTEIQGPGTYTFDVMVSDGSLTDSQSIIITVDEVNIAPVSYGGSTTTHMNTSGSVSMSASDGDLPTNTLTYEIVSGPTNGTLSGVSGNSVNYTPDSDYVGSDSFTFKSNDGTADSNEATINISVDNSAPMIDDKSSILDQDINEELSFTLDIDATDPDATDILTYSLEGIVPTGAAIDSEGLISWTPSEEQGPGSYPFTVSVTDGSSTDTVSFTLNVLEVNVAPVANDGSLEVNEDTSGNVTVLATDVDLPANTLTYSLGSVSPTNGTASIIGNVATYTPNANYNGPDSFTFKVNDGITDSNEGTISVTVNPVNDAPTITLNGSISVAITQPGAYEELGAVCSDIDGENLTASISGIVDVNTIGTYMVTYTCMDSGELSASVTRTVIVQATPAMCNDGIDNDQDELIDEQDPGCVDSLDNDETNIIVDVCLNIEGSQSIIPEGYEILTEGQCTQKVVVTDVCPNIEGVQTTVPSNKKINNSGDCVNKTSSGSRVSGSVLGVSTGQVLGASTSCGIYVDKYIRKGYKNDSDAVMKIQKFLNDYMKSGLKEDGVFGKLTEGALMSFQMKHSLDILAPWGLVKPTGIFYLTTQTAVNNIMCPELKLPTPALVPFEQNPSSPNKA